VVMQDGEEGAEIEFGHGRAAAPLIALICLQRL
jgi:hypothetical protein